MGSRRFAGFRVAFSVQKSIESSSNSAQCSIFALNESSRSELESTKRPAFVIDAGYRDLSGVIFSGEAIRPTSTLSPTGWVTRVEASDGHSAQRAIVNTTLGKGAGVGQVFETLAKSMGVSAQSVIDRASAGDFDGAIKSFAGGLTMSGTAKGQLDRLTSSLGLEWSIQDGELVVLQAQEVRPGEAVRMAPTTGLLGSPELVQDASRPGKKIVRLRSMLNPRINPGVRLAVESKTVSGVFKVTRVGHAGDTFGTNWTSSVEAIELTGVIAT